MEQLWLGHSQDGEILHAEKRRRRTEGVFRIHHDDAAIPQTFFFRNQRRDIDCLGKHLIGQLKIGPDVVGVLKQVLYRPERVEVPVSPSQ